VNKSAFTILLVEDNPAEVQLVKLALAEINPDFSILAFNDGEEALRYLRMEHSHTDALRPDLIIMDVKLPKISGIDLLREIKSLDDLKRIPVVIFSSSIYERDIADAYAQYANSYIIKPVEYESFLTVFRFTIDYWSKIVQLHRTGKEEYRIASPDKFSESKDDSLKKEDGPEV
jgi:chemotaxis family two-component system response regulator Rcp1